MDPLWDGEPASSTGPSRRLDDVVSARTASTSHRPPPISTALADLTAMYNGTDENSQPIIHLRAVGGSGNSYAVERHFRRTARRRVLHHQRRFSRRIGERADGSLDPVGR